MEIKDTVYLVSGVTMYGNKIPNSGQILKAKVVEILADTVTVEVSLGKGKTAFTEVREGEYYKTFGEAINALEPLINEKVKFIDESEYKGEDIPTIGQ